jgi:hypothetical protein
VQERFGLGPDSLRFHRQMTNLKTCPGTSLDLDQIKAAVADARAGMRGAPAARGADQWAGPESLRVREKGDAVMRDWRRTAVRGVESGDAEPAESAMSADEASLHAGLTGTTRPAPSAATRAARGPELTPEMLAALRPHVIDLNQGRFSDEGLFRTSKADVDAIFDDHLPRALEAARAEGRPLRLLFWAHGGLISEASGLTIAHLQVEWWKQNGVYPIHFVWETGFMDALAQILSGARAAGRAVARDIWDHTTDPAVETTARVLGGGKIWGAMKRSAELASRDDGGAAYTAGKLAAFCAAAGGAVELHAVGHSAGSIFHSFFLPVASAMGVPPFKTLQLLAPAIRVSSFRERLLRLVGQQIQSLTMFTMQRDWEEADNVVSVYRKSLLYLIYYALEPERKTPILGLEISVRDDRELADLFGLAGRQGRAEIVWSVTQATSGQSASTSQSHGGFDNDRSTMDSVAYRILGAAPAVTFPDEAIDRGLQFWRWQLEWPPAFGPVTPGVAPATPPLAPPVPIPISPPAVAPPVVVPAATGRRRALCIGIDRYPTMPLAGCVADARDWARTLGTLGFETTLLLDDVATRTRILADLRALISGSQPGDVVVFQYSGHGTELEDIDGDEVDGTNGARDEALCPYDIAQGAFVIDDDLAEIFGAIPDGVNVTCFMDCCHSGTITRVMVGPPEVAAGEDRRARFLPATREMQDAHRRFRERMGRGQASRGGRTPENMRQVVFSACRDYEVAYEVSGHGEFTVRATRLITGGIGGLSHEDFAGKVVAAFGANPRQHPELDCAAPARARGLLTALAGGTANGAGRGAAAGASLDTVADALRALANSLTPRS